MIVNILHVFEVDNYMALFVNNKLVFQDHEIDIKYLNKHCPIEVIEYDWIDYGELQEYVFENGCFPEDYYICLKLMEQ